MHFGPEKFEEKRPKCSLSASAHPKSCARTPSVLEYSVSSDHVNVSLYYWLTLNTSSYSEYVLLTACARYCVIAL